MEEHLPFFNLSIKKVIALEQDSFKRAKIKIVFTILLLSFIKILIVFLISVHYMQYRQLLRIIIIILLFSFLIKMLLYRPSLLPVLSHVMMIGGLATIWTNIFVYAQHINIVTVQFVFMVALVSYYLIGGISAAVYTSLAILPIVLYLLTKGLITNHVGIAPQELAAPGADLIIIINFIAFVLSHFLYYQAFHQNLREKEALNKQLQTNILEAKALAESRSVFLSTMSHELRTPLNGVIGITNLLKESALEEQKENFNILEFSATNLLAVINDILDYNKSELDKIELEVIPVNLSALLQKICYGLEMKAREKALSWKLELDELLKEQCVITDPTRLTQIIYNLAGNAIKFTNKGMITVSANVVDQFSDKMNVQFTISDTGIGIAADRQQAIFNPFTQASSDTTRHYGGTGLGLAIVKRLLMLFGSSIQLKSQPGSGSVFTFAILFTTSPREVKPAAEIKMVNASLSGLRLLVAEDNHINVLLLEKLLSRWGMQVVVARNGQEALTEMSNSNFDGILMDLHMPVMDGYTATAAIRAMHDSAKANIPIIAITASVSRNLNAKIKEAGIDDYVSKPFQSEHLYEKLQQIFAPAIK